MLPVTPTVPIPRLMLTELIKIPVTVQLRVDEPGLIYDTGSPENTIVGGSGTITVTVTCAVLVPAGPVAVRVYVVVSVGVTVIFPGPKTSPIPLSIDAVVKSPKTSQVRTELLGVPLSLQM